MNFVEPIRAKTKILAIKNNLREEESPRNYLLFTLGINSALRGNDLLQLRVKDLINGTGEIKEYLYTKESKTKREAKIYLNEPIRTALNFYLMKEKGLDPNDFLFYSFRNRSRAISRVRVWKLIREWTDKVGLDSERYGFHSLRKTWGYQARLQGASITMIREKLGHKNEEVTKRYIGITREEVNRLEREICI
jgi:integrase